MVGEFLPTDGTPRKGPPDDLPRRPPDRHHRLARRPHLELLAGRQGQLRGGRAGRRPDRHHAAHRAGPGPRLPGVPRPRGRLPGPRRVRQFLDIGPGLPTEDNTHEVAQRIAPESRIVYVDNDPLVLAHAHALLTSTPEGACGYLDADLRDPDRILEGAAQTLDFSEPIALMLMGIVEFITDHAQAYRIVAHLREALPSGSYLVMYDGTNVIHGEASDEIVRVWNQSGNAPLVLRTPEQITAFLDGLEIVEPGVVPVNLWRPEPGPWEIEAVDAYGAVGYKP
jgi:hypothetical protein